MDIQHLRRIAEKLNVVVSKNLTAEKLEAKLKEYCTENKLDFEKEAEATISNPELENLTFEQLDKTYGEIDETKNLKEANRLVHCNIACNNPNKRAYEGEIFCAGNAKLGEIKKYVPFNVDTHVPTIILNMIKEKQCQLFTERTRNGVTTTESKIIPEYTVRELPPLTSEEYDAIQKRQLAQGDD